jgi:hypothetical protein
MFNPPCCAFVQQTIDWRSPWKCLSKSGVCIAGTSRSARSRASRGCRATRLRSGCAERLMARRSTGAGQHAPGRSSLRRLLQGGASGERRWQGCRSRHRRHRRVANARPYRSMRCGPRAERSSFRSRRSVCRHRARVLPRRRQCLASGASSLAPRPIQFPPATLRLSSMACATWAGSKARTSTSTGASPTGIASCCNAWSATWSAPRST